MLRVRNPWPSPQRSLEDKGSTSCPTRVRSALASPSEAAHAGTGGRLVSAADPSERPGGRAGPGVGLLPGVWVSQG